MANKNFEVKHGLSVGGTERITAAGAGSLTNLTLSGNLTVQGTTVTLDASTLQVADKNIVLNYHASNDTSSAANGAGITIQDAVNSSTDATILWNTTDDRFDTSHPLMVNSPTDHSTVAILHAGGGTPNRGLKISTFSATNANAGVNLDAQQTTGVLSFSAGGAEKMRIANDGKVGIGTPSAGSLLTVHNDSVSGNTQLHIHNNKTGDAAVLRLEGKRNSLNDTGQILFANNGNLVAKIDARSAADDGELRFFTSASGSGSSITQRMLIDSDGDVLVGTTTNLNVLSGTPKIQVGDGTGHSSIQWYSGTGSVAGLYFGDATSGAGRYDGYIEYRHNSNEMAFRANGAERMKIGSDGYITFTSTRNEYSMELNSAGTRSGLVLNKPGTSTVMGSVLMLADETYRLGTASNYHIRMDQTGDTYMGNSSNTHFTQNGNLSVNTTQENAGITSGTDVRALGPCFANDANSFTMSQEGTGNADAYLAARGANGSTRGNIRIGVSVSGGGNFKAGVRIDNQGRTTTPENPAFRARATSAQVLASTWRQVGYDSLIQSRGTGYSTSNSRFTAPIAGWYQFNAAWTANANSDVDGTLAIWINGSSSDLVTSTSMPNTSGNYEGHFCGGCCYLDVDDYVTVHRYANVSTTTRSSAPYGGWFSGFLIG